MIDHGYARARDSGNTGRGLAVGLLDATPSGSFHLTRMLSLIGSVVPDARVAGGGATPGELLRVAFAGAAVIALPFTLPGVTDPAFAPDWDAAIRTVSAYGVLLVAAAGDGVPYTPMPAVHPLVWSCAAISATDGSLLPAGSSAAGRIDCGVTSGADAASGAAALAAGMLCQLLGWVVHPFGRPALRLPVANLWLSGGVPLPGGRGRAPLCGTLGE